MIAACCSPECIFLRWRGKQAEDPLLSSVHPLPPPPPFLPCSGDTNREFNVVPRAAFYIATDNWDYNYVLDGIFCMLFCKKRD